MDCLPGGGGESPALRGNGVIDTTHVAKPAGKDGDCLLRRCYGKGGGEGKRILAGTEAFCWGHRTSWTTRGTGWKVAGDAGTKHLLTHPCILKGEFRRIWPCPSQADARTTIYVRSSKAMQSGAQPLSVLLGWTDIH
jgi:hypothetical protein